MTLALSPGRQRDGAADVRLRTRSVEPFSGDFAEVDGAGGGGGLLGLTVFSPADAAEVTGPVVAACTEGSTRGWSTCPVPKRPWTSGAFPSVSRAEPGGWRGAGPLSGCSCGMEDPRLVEEIGIECGVSGPGNRGGEFARFLGVELVVSLLKSLSARGTESENRNGHRLTNCCILDNFLI